MSNHFSNSTSYNYANHTKNMEIILIECLYLAADIVEHEKIIIGKKNCQSAVLLSALLQWSEYTTAQINDIEPENAIESKGLPPMRPVYRQMMTKNG